MSEVALFSSQDSECSKEIVAGRKDEVSEIFRQNPSSAVWKHAQYPKFDAKFAWQQALFSKQLSLKPIIMSTLPLL